MTERSLKLLFSTAVFTLCGYSMSVLGIGLWSLLFALGGGFVLLSAFLKGLRRAGVFLAGTMGLLSLPTLGFLIVVRFVDIHLPTNILLALGTGLILVCLLGFSCVVVGEW